MALPPPEVQLGESQRSQEWSPSSVLSLALSSLGGLTTAGEDEMGLVFFFVK